MLLCLLTFGLSLFELRKLLGIRYIPLVLPILWTVELFLATEDFRFYGRTEPSRAATYFAVFVVVTTCFAVLFRKWRSWVAAEIGSLWIAVPLLCLLALHGFIAAMDKPLLHIPLPWDKGFDYRNAILLAMLPLWAGDTAGIFVGMAFGRHKLAPAISPKKTIEGAIGNLLFSVLVGWGVGSFLGFSMAVSLGCGVVAGTLGQVGDLYQSWLKRQSGVKDSGSILPGHGGILDRIDSLLFTAPAVLLLLTLFGRSP